MDIADPEFIDRYRVDRRIEQHWTQVLYCGFDTKVGQPVVIRVRFRHGLEDDTFAQGVAELYNAARAVASLTHEGIQKVLDVGEGDGFAYLVMECIAGTSLKARFASGERFAPERAVAIARRLLDLLEHVHVKGVVHRNLHPGCVFVMERDAVKLSGFDLARLPWRDKRPADDERPVPMSGNMAVLAPEQVLGTGVDQRTDLFQVGVLLYQMLTGMAPFSAPGAWSLAKKIVQENPPLPSECDSSIPPGLDDVVQVALEKHPERRFASAREFSSFLGQALVRSGRVGAHHIVHASLDRAIPVGRDEPVTENAYEDLAGLAALVQETLARHGSTCAKTVGAELFCYFAASERVMPALRACQQVMRDAASVRPGLHYTILVHHGVLVTESGDAFGDNVGLASRMLAECKAAGIYLSARAVAALPEGDRTALRRADFGFERFIRNPRTAHLVRSPAVYVLTG